MEDLGTDYSVVKWLKNLREEPPQFHWAFACRWLGIVGFWVFFNEIPSSCTETSTVVRDITPMSEEFYETFHTRLTVEEHHFYEDAYRVTFRNVPDWQGMREHLLWYGSITFLVALVIGPVANKDDQIEGEP